MAEADSFPIGTVSGKISEEKHCLLDGQCQLLLQSLVVLVGRQIYAVEASVRLRQLARVARLLDREATRTVGALQVLESVDGNTRRARGELQQTRLALRRPAANALPEPLDNFVVDLVAAVIGELRPVVATAIVSEKTRQHKRIKLTRRFRTFHR